MAQHATGAVLGPEPQAPSTVIHQYPHAVRGKLVRRYKRFLADVIMLQDSDDPTAATGAAAEAGVVAPAGAATVAADTEAVTCHCPNTGPMTGLLDWPLAPVVCSVSTAAGRKYKHTLEMIQSEPGGCWVGVHSALANSLVHALLTRRMLPQLGEWQELQREVPYGSSGSRVDFMLTRPTGRRVFVEVKSVTLAEPYSPAAGQPGGRAGADGCGGDDGPTAAPAQAQAQAEGRRRRIALFPDTVSDRAQRHVRDLIEAVRAGDEACCVFVLQRADCEVFAPCAAKDPAYAALVRQAAAAGVQMLALRTRLRPPSLALPAVSGQPARPAPGPPEPLGGSVAGAVAADEAFPASTSATGTVWAAAVAAPAAIVSGQGQGAGLRAVTRRAKKAAGVPPAPAASAAADGAAATAAAAAAAAAAAVRAGTGAVGTSSVASCPGGAVALQPGEPARIEYLGLAELDLAYSGTVVGGESDGPVKAGRRPRAVPRRAGAGGGRGRGTLKRGATEEPCAGLEAGGARGEEGPSAGAGGDAWAAAVAVDESRPGVGDGALRPITRGSSKRKRTPRGDGSV